MSPLSKAVRDTVRRIGFLIALASPLAFTGSATGCSEYATGTGGNGSTCCRVCTTGKACGDSCIAQNSTCNVGPGCACNG